MMKWIFCVAVSLSVAGGWAVVAAEHDGNPFPRFEEIPAACRMPRNAAISYDAAGNLLVNGKIRYLVGVTCPYVNQTRDLRPTPGYPASLKWIYEEPLTYESAQRLGFDSITSGPPALWARKIHPAMPVEGQSPRNQELARPMLRNGLPFAWDYTAFPWSHGIVQRKSNTLETGLPPEVFNSFVDGHNNHWVAYNVFHPQARALYRMMWADGVEEAKRQGIGTILHYELFNEPAYNEPSEYNKKLFAEALQKEFGSIAEMNRRFRHSFRSFEDAASLWALGDCAPLAVAWGRFQEKGFTELCRLGAETVASCFPGAKSCVQVIGMNYYRVLPMSNINIFEINRHMGAIVTPTSGGLLFATSFDRAPAKTVEAPANAVVIGEGLLQRHLFRAMADGKPIHNGEAYCRRDKQGIANVLWLDMLRGSGATYLFSWCRMLCSWLPAGTAEGGRKLAETNPYVMTNPYFLTPDALTGVMTGKREIMRFADFFVPREHFNSVPREVAVMLSYPTERYGIPSGYSRKNEITQYTAALEFSHYPIDALFEEQLPEGRALRYRALVVPGALCTYPETLPKLAEFVRQGGILIAARGNMPFDEYGNPVQNPLLAGLTLREEPAAAGGTLALLPPLRQPARLPGRIAARGDLAVTADRSWRMIGSLDGKPAVFSRPFGKGQVYFIAPMMSEYAAAGVLGAILDAHGIRPALNLTRVPEGDMAVNIETHLSRKGTLAVAFLFNMDRYPKQLAAELPSGAVCAADLLRNRLLPVSDGRVTLALPENSRFLLGFGSREELEKRFGKMTSVSAAAVAQEYRQLVDAAERERKERLSREFAFNVDAANLVPVNLRPFANRSFVDGKPNDGKGGWTDQGGETSLNGVPWGIQEFAGVPCDLIRYDENGGNSCIMLQAKTLKEKLPARITGIPVHQRAAKIFFFHTSAWSGDPGKVILTYRLHFADGGSRDVPIRSRVDINDWWSIKPGANPDCRVAWKNTQSRGFNIFQWINPEPEREIAFMEMISSCGDAIPAVIGVTVERFTGAREVYRFDTGRLGGWLGARAVKTDDHSLEVKVDGKTQDWSGVRIGGKALKLPPEKWRDAVLRFTVRGGANAFGTVTDGLAATVKLTLFDSKMRSSNGYVLKSADRVREVTIPIGPLLAKKTPLTDVSLLSLQFNGVATAGFFIENLRIEYQK